MQNGIEWVSIVVEGQSFLLHMIRKMVGFTMAIVRGYTTIDVLDNAWKAPKVAPSFLAFSGPAVSRSFFAIFARSLSLPRSWTPGNYTRWPRF